MSSDFSLGRLLVAAGVRGSFEAFEVLDEAEQSSLSRLVAAVGLDFEKEGDDGVILLLCNLGQRAVLIAGFYRRIVLHGGLRLMLESIVRAGRTRQPKPIRLQSRYTASTIGSRDNVQSEGQNGSRGKIDKNSPTQS
jgi:hypothetical protein